MKRGWMVSRVFDLLHHKNQAGRLVFSGGYFDILPKYINVNEK